MWKLCGSLCLWVMALTLTGCYVNAPIYPFETRQELRERVLVKPDHSFTRDKVLLIPVSGLLTVNEKRDGFFKEPGTVPLLKAQLKMAEEDDRIGAVLLRVDSPGGSVMASDLLYHEIRQFRERTGKKVVVQMMGLAASGGYYLSLAADRIYAQPVTITGSLAVVSLFPNLSELGRKIGVDVNVVKSGKWKDMGSMWRKMSPEERAIFQGVVDEMHEQFVKTIQEGRPDLTEEGARALADGRIYTAGQALEKGLVDGISYLEETFKATRELAGMEDGALVTYDWGSQGLANVYTHGTGPTPRMEKEGAQVDMSLFRLDMPAMTSREPSPFYYLWTP